MCHLGVLSLLLGGLLLDACGSSTHPEAPREAVTGVDSGAVILHAAYSGFGEPDRFVVRDSAQWAGVWATAFARQTPVPPLPSVDFATEMVVVAALGARPSGGYDIAIEGVAPEVGGAAVRVVTTAPGDNCYTTAAITEPVVMLRVGAVAGRIRFHERAETRFCPTAAAPPAVSSPP
jgi:protease stability complex PrcB-like protein